MKKQYFAVLYEDWLIETSWESLKRLKYMIREQNKHNFYKHDLKDYTICEYIWDENKYEVDYYLDRELYVLDKAKDELIEFDEYKEHDIKFRIIPKDFLYLKKIKW